MSDTVNIRGTYIYVTRYTGPVREDGGSRLRYSLYNRTSHSEDSIEFSAEEWDAFIEWCKTLVAHDVVFLDEEFISNERN